MVLPPPNRPLPAADVGFAVVPKLNPPPVDAPPLVDCALPKRPPDAGAVDPKGEDDAPELLPAPEVKLNADMADVDDGYCRSGVYLSGDHG